MGFLVVSESGMHLCETGGCSEAQMLPGNVLEEMEGPGADAIVIAGSGDDPLEMAWRLHVRSGRRKLPVIILSSISEIFDGAGTSCSPRLAEVSKLRTALERRRESPMSLRRRVTVDIPGREVIVENKRAICSPVELRLLTLFLRYPDVVFSRTALLQRISSNWTSVSPRMIDVLVRRLRREIEAEPASPAHLLTIPNWGYVFRHDSDVFYDRLTGDRFAAWPQRLS